MVSNLRPTHKFESCLSQRLSTDPPLHTGPAGAPTPTGRSQREDEHAYMQNTETLRLEHTGSGIVLGRFECDNG